ncbi:MAG: sodium:proton antiporter [Propionibacteriaceae bacterium]|jgi:CPA1 family monovalent cation:H+ antiporter|nr:sodium:proton antiporter [Propionibacteriaceae bacterium]
MPEILPYVGLAVVVIAVVIALSAVSDRLGVAPPLILMLVGVGVSLLPFMSPVEIAPDWILAVVLPPLLYSAAIAMPTVEFRRDLTAVGGLAILLVIVSALVVGVIVHLVIPGIPWPIAIALGAIISPTDAAATRIARRLGVPSRVGIILDGESLLNDATALVLLRTAVAATAATVSVWGVALAFVWAALGAVGIGMAVGWAGVRLRRLVHDPAPATAISILLPFVAYLLSEAVDASGLVAVVAAGIVAAQLGPHHLDARQRISERANWHTLAFLLEGAVFLVMGLELDALITDLHSQRETIWHAVGIAGLAIIATLLVRAAYIALLVRGTSRRTSRKVARREHFRRVREAEPGRETDPVILQRHEELLQRRAQLRARFLEADPSARAHLATRRERLRLSMKRYLADVEYLLEQPLGWREGTLLTWAGMRGVVTLAAAQTLPRSADHRSLLILTAFFVAAGSLVLQGGTISLVIQRLGLAGQDAAPEGEWARLQEELAGVTGPPAPDRPERPEGTASTEGTPPGDATSDCPDTRAALARLHAQREVLLEWRAAGEYSCHSLITAFAELDAEEMRIQLRLTAEC